MASGWGWICMSWAAGRIPSSSFIAMSRTTEEIQGKDSDGCSRREPRCALAANQECGVLYGSSTCQDQHQSKEHEGDEREAGVKQDALVDFVEQGGCAAPRGPVTAIFDTDCFLVFQV